MARHGRGGGGGAAVAMAARPRGAAARIRALAWQARGGGGEQQREGRYPQQQQQQHQHQQRRKGPSYKFKNEEEKVKWMRRASETYLGRYATTAENLRRVLERRVRRAEMRSGVDVMTEELREGIDRVVAEHVASGVVNDLQYATARAASMRRTGKSTRAVRQMLAARGVPRAVVDRVAPDESAESEDLAAALAYCRRRRMGPYRRDASAAPDFEKEMARMARQGFRYDTVRRVLRMSADEAALI